jgi:serine/threonine protein kinase
MTEFSELDRARARVGKTLHGKYRLDAVLGVGSSAAVYAATHRNKKRFAVKMLHPELSRQQDVRTRFLREGYVANTIEHPNALAVLDDDIAEDGAAFVVMELLKGLTVEELWESHSQRLPPRVVLALAQGLLEVLAAAHVKSIVHRDIKPANLFVLADGTVKVLDFGIARFYDTANVGATSHGMVLGTPAFLPPEQAKGETGEVDQRTDIWAVGATMFTLLSGSLVHEGASGMQMVVKAATEPPRSLAAVAPDVAEAIVSIVDKALAFENVHRWETADAMRDAIESAHLSLFGEALSKSQTAALMADRSAHILGMAAAEAEAAEALAQSDGAMREVGELASGPTLLAESVNLPSLAAFATDDPRNRHDTTEVMGTAPTLPRDPPDEATSKPISSAPPPSERRKSSTPMRLPLAVVGGALTLAIFVAVVKPTDRGTIMQPAPTASAIPSLVVSQPPTEKKDDEANAPSSRQTSVALMAFPATARLFVDDVLLPTNPYAAKFARDGREHVVRAEAPGFLSKTSTLKFDDPEQMVTLKLDRDPHTVAQAPPSPQQPAADAGKRVAEHVVTVTEAASAPTAAAAPPTAPPKKLLPDRLDPWKN